jgi:hypothetical protein
VEPEHGIEGLRKDIGLSEGFESSSYAREGKSGAQKDCDIGTSHLSTDPVITRQRLCDIHPLACKDRSLRML